MKKTFFDSCIAWIILAVILMIVSAGCQPTPEKEIVANRNKDLVQEVQSAAGEEAGETNLPGHLAMLDLPEHYTYTSENETASLTINVDADIYKPDADGMPLARVKPMDFTQEMVTGMFNYLFPDEKPYLPREQLTKSEIEEQIVNYERILARGTIDGDPIREDTIEQFDQIISELQEQWETAPVEVPDPVISDGTLKYVENTGTGMIQDADGSIQEITKTVSYYELNVRLDDTSLWIMTGGARSTLAVWYINVDTNFSTDGMAYITKDDELPEAARDKLTIPLSDAVAKADGFFEAAGMDDVALFASYVVDNHGTGHVDDNWDPASEYAYKLFYTHTVDGVPVSCHESDSASGGEYSEPWFYESIEFLISDDGILEINWREPCTVTEAIEDDVALIDFDDAMEKFENAAGYTYGQYLDWGEDVEVTMEVKIDNIQLNLIRLREKGKPDEKAGLYVPAYVFYGYVKETCVYENEDYIYEGYRTSKGGGNDFYPGPFMVMAVNAIDGSIINTMADIN